MVMDGLDMFKTSWSMRKEISSNFGIGFARNVIEIGFAVFLVIE